MRLILHIGMPKAGSTALQTAFAEARRPLRAAGILYPKGAFNHNFLIAGMVTPGFGYYAPMVQRIVDAHHANA